MYLQIKYHQQIYQSNQKQQFVSIKYDCYKLIGNQFYNLLQTSIYQFTFETFYFHFITQICLKTIKNPMQFFSSLSQATHFNASHPSDISFLMQKIQDTTLSMNQTFEQSILKHQEQFIKAYKIKIYELTKLFHQLKKNVQDKFINNSITQQLETVIKERDYFKYECLKLNTQYKNVLEDYKNVAEQMVNVTEQMEIYKQLLESQKIKSSEIQKNAKKLKYNLTELASKTIHDVNMMQNNKKTNKFTQEEKQKIKKMKKEIKEKTQTIRALRAKIQEIDEFSQNKINIEQEKKELHEVFRFCVESWKREIISKSRKQLSNKYSAPNLQSQMMSRSSLLGLGNCSAEQFSSMQKKQLLQMLFSQPQFLQFLERLLFDKHFEVQFVEAPDCGQNSKDQVMIKNRNKLYDYMKKKGLVSSVINKPVKFR